jgi:hypothetical protein
MENKGFGNEYSKRMLNEYIKQKIFTTGIGAIDDIEEIFKDILIDNEELWKKLRKAILDRVNYQYKLMNSTLDDFEVEKKGQVTLIGIMKENKNENRGN